MSRHTVRHSDQALGPRSTGPLPRTTIAIVTPNSPGTLADRNLVARPCHIAKYAKKPNIAHNAIEHAAITNTLIAPGHLRRVPEAMSEAMSWARRNPAGTGSPGAAGERTGSLSRPTAWGLRLKDAPASSIGPIATATSPNFTGAIHASDQCRSRKYSRSGQPLRLRTIGDPCLEGKCRPVFRSSRGSASGPCGDRNRRLVPMASSDPASPDAQARGHGGVSPTQQRPVQKWHAVQAVISLPLQSSPKWDKLRKVRRV